MKLKDWFRARKEKRAERRRMAARRSAEPEEVFVPLDADTEGIEPPESRYTEEYREFIEKEKAARAASQRAAEEYEQPEIE